MEAVLFLLGKTRITEGAGHHLDFPCKKSKRQFEPKEQKVVA